MATSSLITTRGALMRACLLLLLLVTALAPAAASATAATVTNISLTNGGRPFTGDNRLLTTISPNGDGIRDRATIHFRLSAPAVVHFEIAAVDPRRPKAVETRTVRLGAGQHSLVWAPSPKTEPRTYLALLRVRGTTYGALRYTQAGRLVTPVIRVRGVDASFSEESYAPGSTARLTVSTDARSLRLDVLRSGPGHDPRLTNFDVFGPVMDEPITVAWNHPNSPHAINVSIGNWPSGVYFLRLTADDGRVGYAPLIVRPARLGEHRVAVVMPTFTWQAYNFEDENGDGWGDSWYVSWDERATVRLGRHYVGRGIPPHFRQYDLNFLHWLTWRDRGVDYLADSDIASGATAAKLALAYDLIIFPGHHEYITPREFRVMRGYRNRGGNLAYLSANNFYWHTVRHGDRLQRTATFRSLGEPEEALMGAQYRANNGGQNQKPWVVVHAEVAPWLFIGTGLHNGSSFGRGGVEIDEIGGAAPAGTKMIATIPHVIGNLSAQMSFYEKGGAKVFSAGAFTLAGQATSSEVSPLLDNLWRYMTKP
jgi:N,N-dimethylformamidase beta subunit-like, C-terminal